MHMRLCVESGAGCAHGAFGCLGAPPPSYRRGRSGRCGRQGPPLPGPPVRKGEVAGRFLSFFFLNPFPASPV